MNIKALLAILCVPIGIIAEGNLTDQTRAETQPSESETKKTAAAKLGDDRARARAAAQRAKEKPTERVIATVALTAAETSVKITNHGTNDWMEATVYIDGIWSGYSGRIGAVRAGQSVRFALRGFTKDDGERFNPLARRPTEIIVTVPGKDPATFKF